MKIVQACVLVAVALVALSGCQGQDSAIHGPTIAPPTPTTSPTPTAVVYSAPDQVFEGSCAALFSEAEVSEMLGTTVTLVGDSLRPYVPGTYSPTVQAQIVPQLGGIRCDWEAEYPAPSLVLLALPSGVLTIGEQGSCTVDYGITSCGVDATVNGIRISGAVIQSDDSTAATLQGVADKVEAVFGERAAQTVAVPAPVPSATAWRAIPTCEQLESNAEIRALVVSEPSFIGTWGSDGGYIYLPAEGDVYSRTDTEYSCPLNFSEGGQEYFCYFSALGGGRWNEDLLAQLPGAERETVAGFDAVITLPVGDGFSVEAFVDDNWISAYAANPETVYPVMRALAAMLR